ncbi:ureidoglycolate lyase [Thalassovita aquimarina]|uniref:Ureidoglycolate lyase n=1 Tax=Thalassovita aquimarina TaxID=2785917 RepID=A0ABS5HMI8_9RHOB|nr:ureidoglycolate lyase [Thalassovita aquimarina]MBR9650170.1 ureidoglycolate lyase [Thalassovita aquimarina]
MTNVIKTEPLTAAAFAPFGDVLEAEGAPDKIINQGFCGRFHDRAQLDFGPGGRAGISIFKAEQRSLPYTLDLVERHPEGSQAFIPMSQHEWLVVVAEDDRGAPARIRAFIAAPGQAINFHRGTWHGVLTPLHAPGLFAVVDRIGDTKNLQEYQFRSPYQIKR